MTRCLRVRVGGAYYLAPSQAIGRIGSNDALADGIRPSRRFDARRLFARSEQGDPIALEWRSECGRGGAVVLVDEVLDLVEIDEADVSGLPRSIGALASLFDGVWHDGGRDVFLLRLHKDPARSFRERRRRVRALRQLRET